MITIYIEKTPQPQEIDEDGFTVYRDTKGEIVARSKPIGYGTIELDLSSQVVVNEWPPRLTDS